MAKREEIVEVLTIEMTRIESSTRVRLSLLRAGARWHVACRRGYQTEEGARDYGGEDTFIEQLSVQDKTETEARAWLCDAIPLLLSASSWVKEFD